ncbi:MAG TPA: hypothetical protein VLF41_00970 [Candidatus Nanoarchaeia archaeon]|nr:hypothetical protein [Candidatus Nanoarchaeia archaeon]
MSLAPLIGTGIEFNPCHYRHLIRNDRGFRHALAFYIFSCRGIAKESRWEAHGPRTPLAVILEDEKARTERRLGRRLTAEEIHALPRHFDELENLIWSVSPLSCWIQRFDAFIAAELRGHQRLARLRAS